MMNDYLQRDKQVRRIILLEGLANLLVLIIKFTVGLSTGSMAIIADAIHSLTDIANNIVAWIVMRFSYLPADREHPYGHRKFETLAVFILASLLMVLSFELALNAIRKEASEVATSNVELVVMFCVVAVNITVTVWERMWAKRLDSDILRADASHTFADVLTSLVVIAGWQLSAMGYIWIDRLCALGVSVIIVFLAFNLFRRTMPVLLDEYSIQPEELSRIVQNVDGVKDVYNIRSRWAGNVRTVDLVISVDPALTTEESHEIADQIEYLLEKRFAATDVSIHVEPDLKA
jgi:cation diffusion facilitator family transporter